MPTHFSLLLHFLPIARNYTAFSRVAVVQLWIHISEININGWETLRQPSLVQTDDCDYIIFLLLYYYNIVFYIFVVEYKRINMDKPRNCIRAVFEEKGIK